MLHIDEGDVLPLTVEEFIGQRIAILGISGSGKTNTVAVLAEELLSHLPLTIIDVEGEYYGLKTRYPLLVAGRSEHAEVPLMAENAAAIAELSLQHAISVILDLSEYDQEEMYAILLIYFEQLWKLATTLKSPYEIVIEEAHEFVPQGQRTPLKTLLTRFALRGRKRGVGVILASQRSAKVEKDLLTQANLLILHQVVHPTDLTVYKDLIPLAAKDVEQQARELAPGEAFVVRRKQVDRVRMRLRHTFHAGATPTLGGAAQVQLKAVDIQLLEELQRATERAVKEGGSGNELARLKKQLREAEALMAAQQDTIAELQRRLEMVSTLRVELPSDALSLPETMHIQQAHVDELHVPTLPARVIEALPVVPQLERVATATDSDGTIELGAIEQLRYDDFKRSLRRLVRDNRRADMAYGMLRILAQTPGGEMFRADLLLALPYSRRTFESNGVVSILQKKHLIAVSQHGHAMVYRSLLQNRLKGLFPARNDDESRLLVGRLFEK